MKLTHVLLGVFSSAATVSGWAQAVEFITVTRQAAYVQTGALVSDINAAATPFTFRASIDGDSAMTATNPLTAVTFTRPGGSPTALTFDTQNHSWNYADSTPTSMDNLNTAYTTGTYTFTPTGTPNTDSTVTVGSFAATLLQIPFLTLSGGSWSSGAYTLAANATLTISSNAVFSGTPGANDAFHVDASISGVSFTNGPEGFVNWDPTTSAAGTYASTPANFVVGAGTLAPGSYTIEYSFDDVQNPAGAYVTAFSASLLEYRTTINLTVVPESSTFAAVLGAIALLGAGSWRRRRQA